MYLRLRLTVKYVVKLIIMSDVQIIKNISLNLIMISCTWLDYDYMYTYMYDT